MKIICKVKDYYDFIGYQNDSENIIFDRRNYYIITDKQQFECSFKETSINSFITHLLSEHGQLISPKILGFWCGFSLYLFRISVSNIPPRNYYSSDYEPDYDVDLIGFRRCYEIKHTKAIDFVTIDTTSFEYYNFKLNSFKAWNNYKKLKQDLNAINEDLLTSNIANWKITPLYDDNEYPILKETFIPRFINADIMYRNIEDWLIAQHNDVDQESIGITDVDKAINHGFDKKTSFRSIK